MGKTLVKKFLPKTLLGRSTLIVILPVLLLQVLTVYIFYDRHWSNIVGRLAVAVAGEVTVIADTVDHSDDRDKTLNRVLTYTARNLDLNVRFLPGARLIPGYDRGPFFKRLVIDELARALAARLHRPFSVLMIADDRKYLISVQLNDGVLQVEAAERRLYSSSSYIFLLWMVSISLLLTLISMMFLRNQIRPIRKLAVAAERFGRGLDVDNFKPEGAREVRAAARAFIDMRDRIRRQVEQRTVMLAGISHDMRTPLTRMKLALTLLPDGDDVRALKMDVMQMEQMLQAYLDFVKADAEERPEATDIHQLIKDIVVREQQLGLVVTMQIDDPIYMTVRPVAIARAVGNILGNARRYATKSHLVVHMMDKEFIMTIEDNGPGIDPADYERALRPFVRLESGRTVDHGGVGLGLAIARDLIQAHGGDLTLSQSENLGGLCVTIHLPR